MRLAIAEKGLHCEEYDVSLPLSEHNEPWFMRLNPTGEVPVLVHGDSVICEPTQIMDHLEHNFTEGKITMTAAPSYKSLQGCAFFLFLIIYVDFMFVEGDILFIFLGKIPQLSNNYEKVCPAESSSFERVAL